VVVRSKMTLLALTISRSRVVKPLGGFRRFAGEAKSEATSKPKGWWHSAEFWGAMGALAGWGMTGAAVYDATTLGPEVISLNMVMCYPACSYHRRRHQFLRTNRRAS
jgi:hypothetical protein